MQFGFNQVDWRSALVGTSVPMESVVRIIQLAAPRRSTVLITGETGTGKEVAARAIHAASGRADRPMVTVNCGAIPSNLIEAELFGHVRGAYTGAVQSRAGRFEEANTGTIFLDEIGELPMDVQAKLLRVLQEREVQRLGSSETISLDIRVIAATNCNLEDAVRKREFRQDLFYRLSVVPLRMPALRERVQDIRALAQHFVDAICRSENLPPKWLADRAIAALLAYSWPGNVRQLQHVVEMAVVLSGERTMLVEEDFALPTEPEMNGLRAPEAVYVPETGLDFDATVSRFERSILEQALSKCAGNKAKAAEILGMKRTTLLAKLKALNMAGSIDTRSACA
jgi:transcriptional regulator with PAS, ATPase and Fis domain